MNKHTPGPWRIAEVQPARYPSYPIVNGDGAHVTRVDICAHGRSGADAALIAAAPDLLAALQRATEVMGVLLYEPTIDQSAHEKAIALARAAIAKAEGR